MRLLAHSHFIMFLTITFLLCVQLCNADEYSLNTEELEYNYVRYRSARDSKGVIENVPVNVEWLTDEQLSELGDLDSVGRLEKIQSFYDQIENADTKKAAAKRIVTQCYDWLPEVTTEEERAEIDGLHKENKHTECKTQVEKFMEKLPEEKQTQLRKYWSFCEKVWYENHQHVHQATEEGDQTEHAHHHSKRNIKKIRNMDCRNTFDGCFNGHLNWMTGEEKNELQILQANGATKRDFVKQMFSFYNDAQGKRKKLATRLLEIDCRKMILYAFGKEKATLMNFLRESDMDEVFGQQKVSEFINEIRDPRKKAIAIENEPYCREIFKNSKKRLRRSISETTDKLEDYLKSHLSWLTDEQKNLVRTLKGEGKTKSELQKKVFEFYEETTGEVKEKATELLRGGCEALLSDTVGEDKLLEIKKLKESGASNVTISDKIEEWVEGVQDEHKKTNFKLSQPYCKGLYGVSSRMRRHQGGHDLEDYLKSHLSWLTEEQKTLIRSLKEQGKTRTELQQKIFEFYEEATGEVKEKATALLKGGCRAVLIHVIGEEKTDELKTMKESGATVQEIGKKMDELIDGLEDEHKKSEARQYGPYCKKIYNVDVPVNRRRRHSHTDHGKIVEDYLRDTLSWLTDVQKDEIRSIKSHSRAELQKKVLEFYEQSTGSVREKATELLEGRCRQVLSEVVGDEKANEVKSLRESGASFDDISNKIDELLNGIEDEHKRHLSKEIGPNCKKLLSGKSSKKRRNVGGLEATQKLEEHLKSTLSWLNDEQKKVLKLLIHDARDRKQIHQKIMEFYEHTEGETREKATELLRGSCRTVLSELIGEDKAAEIKTMKEAGATKKEINAKVEELIEQIQDATKKEKAKEYYPYCKKIYQVDTEARMRRHHPESADRLEEFLKSHLSWLTDEQKNLVRTLKGEGKTKSELQKKVFEFYEETTGEVKEKATELLRGGCEALLSDTVGEDKLLEIKKLKESGASNVTISDKIEEWVEGVQDEHKKTNFKLSQPYCKGLYGFSSRMRRHHPEGGHNLEDYLKTHLSWLTDEQKNEIRTLKDEGKSRSELQQKVFEYFEQATGESKEKASELLKGGCRSLLTTIVGEDKATQLKNFKEYGATIKELGDKIDEFVAGIDDEHKKMLAKEYGPYCRKVFNVEATRRRRDLSGVDEHLRSALNWLNDEQKTILKLLVKDGMDRDHIQKKIINFYDATSGEVREKATSLLKSACRQLFASAVGENKAEELIQLKENGASYKEISDRAEHLIALIEEEGKKNTLKRYGPFCKRLFNIDEETKSKNRKRRDLNDENEIQQNIKRQYKWLTNQRKRDNGNNDEETTNNNDGQRDEVQENIQKQYKWLKGERQNENENKNQNDNENQNANDIVDDHIKKHNQWLTNDQQDEIRQLKESGSDGPSITEKLLGYLHLTDMSTKGIAINLLSTGCEKILERFFGSENVQELRQTSQDQIDSKVSEMADGINDPSQRAQAMQYGSVCRKVFTMILRKKRNVQTGFTSVPWQEPKYPLETYFQTHFSWLKSEQRAELRQLAATGFSRTALQQKIYDYYTNLYGEEMLNAKEQIKNGCWELVNSMLDQGSIRELEEMKVNRVSELTIGQQISKLLKEVAELSETQLNHEKELGLACRKVLHIY